MASEGEKFVVGILTGYPVFLIIIIVMHGIIMVRKLTC